MADKKPKFDPNAPYQAAGAVQFNPNAAYSDATDAPAPTVTETTGEISATPLGERLTRIERAPAGETFPQAVVRGLGNVGAGAMAPLVHPVQALESVGGMITAPFEVMSGRSVESTVPYQAVKSFQEDPQGTAQAAVGQAALAEVGGEVLPRVAKTTARMTGDAARSLTGTAPRAVKPLVESTEKANARISDINAKRAEMNAKAAARVNEANRQAQAVADARNQERATAHKEQVQEALHETAGREIEHKQAVATKAEEIRTQEAGEAAKLEKDYQDELAKVRAANEAAQKTAADKNATAQAKHDAQVAQHKALSEATEKLNADDRSLKAQLQQVYEATKAEANAKYEAFKGKMEGSTADPEFLPNALVEASGKIRGSDTVPTLFKDMENRTKRGDIPTFDDLQGYRSELGRELQRSLPDDVYYAYKGLLENIDDEMARMARSKSPAMAKQLADARDYYRRYAKAFLDRTSPLRKALDDPEAHGFLRRVRGKEISGVEAIRQFNKELADATQGALSLADEIRAPRGRSPLETPKPVGEAPKPVQAKTTVEPSRPAPRLTSGSPEERAAQAVKQPERVEAPDRPSVVVAEVKPSPEPKQPLPRKTVDVGDIQQAKAESLEKRAERLRGSHSPIVSSIAAYDAIRSAIAGNWKRVALDLGARALYGSGKSGLARLIEQPSIANFLTRATVKDVAAIPPDLRGPIAQMVSLAQGEGVPVSPAFSGTGMGTLGIAPRKHPTDEYAGH